MCASRLSCIFWKVSLLLCLHYTHTQTYFSHWCSRNSQRAGTQHVPTHALSLSLSYTHKHKILTQWRSRNSQRAAPPQVITHTHTLALFYTHTHISPTGALSTHRTQPSNTHLHTLSLSLSYTYIHTLLNQWRSRNSQHAAHSWTWRKLAVRQGMPTSRP